MNPYWRRQFTTPGDLDEVPTTKRFARSTNEAFPQSAEYGAAIEAPPRKHRVANAVGWILSAILIALMLSSPHWWPL